MVFAKRLREGVRRGEITCSVRIWQSPRVKVGSRYRMEDGEIEIDSIEPMGAIYLTIKVDYAGKTHKDVWLGVEASELPTEPMATFYALGNAKMEDAFRAAEDAFANSRGFAGVAVEWYDTYIALKE